MVPNGTATPARRFFYRVTAYPKTILLVSVLALVLLARFIPQIEVDTRSTAFLPPDDPALQHWEQARETFGLADPMVVAVVRDAPEGVFTPEALELVRTLSERLAEMPGVDPERITSLATEKNLAGSEAGLDVERFLETPPRTREEAAALREAVMDFPLYVGSLVAEDGTATVILVELLERRQATAAYEATREMIAELSVPEGVAIHVAGQGAVTGYLSTSVLRETSRMLPVTFLLINLVLLLSYRSWRGLLLPNLLAAAAVVSTLGLMAMTGVPIYITTNAMIVVLIAVAVADGIHIMGQYYEEAALRPEASQRELVVDAMAAMWRPVTITTLTDMAGFLGIHFASYMPPLRAWGLFAAIGVLVAMVFALLVLPAILVLLRRKESPVVSRSVQPGAEDADLGAALAGLGRLVYRRAPAVLAIGALAAVFAAYWATQVRLDEERIENFAHDEPIYQAARTIDRRLDGANFLDVLVVTPEAEGLLEPAKLRKIEALQRFLEGLPHVHGTTSIVDFLKQMNRALNDGDPEAYRLPDSPDLIAQYLLLYTASASPTDLEEYVDYDYRLANVRARLDSGRYSQIRPVVHEARSYLEEEFDGDGIEGELTGRVFLDHEWLSTLGRSHFRSVIIAFLLVALLAVVSFRSPVAGLLAMLPICAAGLTIYSTLGATGVWLGVATSMSVAIALGTGVDFAVHTIDRLIVMVREHHLGLEEAFAKTFPTTGRALLFSFAAIFLGFGALMVSVLPPNVHFAGLIAQGVAVSFLVSLTVLPAVLRVLRPGFLGLRNAGAGTAGVTLVALALGAGTLAPLSPLRAEPEGPSGLEVAERINARDDGVATSRELHMQLVDRRGKVREREVRVFRKYFGEEKRTVLFFEQPRNVRGTAFLTYDYPEPDREDDQWLYLPALRRVRRISAAERGDYFLGTDFTYEEIKKETKVSLTDYERQVVGRETVDGVECYVLESTPVTEEVARELGYSKVRSWVDPEIWFIRKSEYWDIAGNPLKVIHVRDIRKVEGIWTAHTLEAENHKTGHRTLFTVSNVDYGGELDDQIFTRAALRRGP